MQIALHNLATRYTNLLTSIRIAGRPVMPGSRSASTSCNVIWIRVTRLQTLRPLFEEVPPIGLSYVQDIERQEPEDYEALLGECKARCVMAEKIGCPMVQLLTGPLDPNGAVSRDWRASRGPKCGG